MMEHFQRISSAQVRHRRIRNSAAARRDTLAAYRAAASRLVETPPNVSTLDPLREPEHFRWLRGVVELVMQASLLNVFFQEPVEPMGFSSTLESVGVGLELATSLTEAFIAWSEQSPYEEDLLKLAFQAVLTVSPTRESPPETVLRLERFTKKSIEEFMVPGIARQATRRATAMQAHAVIASGDETRILRPSESGLQTTYLVHGPGHFVVEGTGVDPSAFEERGERLTFFAAPGTASGLSLTFEALVAERRDLGVYARKALSLTRGGDYFYMINGQRAWLLSSDWEQVHLQTKELHVRLPAQPFWDAVFGTDGLTENHARTMISLSHTGALLGLSVVTLERQAGGGLPVAGPTRAHRGVRREGLEQYLLYRQDYPSGLPRSQAKGWQRWQEVWGWDYRMTRDCYRRSLSLGQVTPRQRLEQAFRSLREQRYIARHLVGSDLTMARKLVARWDRSECIGYVFSSGDGTCFDNAGNLVSPLSLHLRGEREAILRALGDVGLVAAPSEKDGAAIVLSPMSTSPTEEGHGG